MGIEKSGVGDWGFGWEKEGILEKMNVLFFEDLKGSYGVEKCENNGIIFLRYGGVIRWLYVDWGEGLFREDRN